MIHFTESKLKKQSIQTEGVDTMAETSLQPIFDYILVDEFDGEEKTQSGIIIPDAAQDETIKKGEVIAHGEGMVTSDGGILELRVEEGDVVLFTMSGANEVSDKGETRLMIRQQNVMAIVDE